MVKLKDLVNCVVVKKPPREEVFFLGDISVFLYSLKEGGVHLVQPNFYVTLCSNECSCCDQFSCLSVTRT